MSSVQLVDVDSPIDAELLASHVDGHHVPAGSTLADLVSGDRAKLLVFLRHYG